MPLARPDCRTVYVIHPYCTVARHDLRSQAAGVARRAAPVLSLTPSVEEKRSKAGRLGHDCKPRHPPLRDVMLQAQARCHVYQALRCCCCCTRTRFAVIQPRGLSWIISAQLYFYIKMRNKFIARLVSSFESHLRGFDLGGSVGLCCIVCVLVFVAIRQKRPSTVVIHIMVRWTLIILPSHPRISIDQTDKVNLIPVLLIFGSLFTCPKGYKPRVDIMPP